MACTFTADQTIVMPVTGRSKVGQRLSIGEGNSDLFDILCVQSVDLLSVNASEKVYPLIVALHNTTLIKGGSEAWLPDGTPMVLVNGEVCNAILNGEDDDVKTLFAAKHEGLRLLNAAREDPEKTAIIYSEENHKALTLDIFSGNLQTETEKVVLQLRVTYVGVVKPDAEDADDFFDKPFFNNRVSLVP